MPAATTHVEFAKDVYRTMDEDLKLRVCNKQMFWLGSQGPDMLFFSKASVLPGSLHKYGNLMHDEKVPEFMEFFGHWIADDPDLVSYYMGFICHYALDSTAHPLSMKAPPMSRWKRISMYGCCTREEETFPPMM